MNSCIRQMAMEADMSQAQSMQSIAMLACSQTNFFVSHSAIYLMCIIDMWCTPSFRESCTSSWEKQTELQPGSLLKVFLTRGMSSDVARQTYGACCIPHNACKGMLGALWVSMLDVECVIRICQSILKRSI